LIYHVGLERRFDWRANGGREEETGFEILMSVLNEASWPPLGFIFAKT
jgi:hypothetical protein